MSDDAAKWKAKHDALLYQYNACHADKQLLGRSYDDAQARVQDAWKDAGEWREIAENLAYDLRVAVRVLTGKQEPYSLDSFDEALAAFDRKVAEP